MNSTEENEMGCDIHGAIEKLVDSKWVMVDRLKSGSKARERNYERFAALAGVRGDGLDPKGIPEDLSDSTKLHIDEWGSDGHSHSFMGLKDAAKIFLATEYPQAVKSNYAKEFPASHYFDIEDDDVSGYRLVFWFDN